MKSAKKVIWVVLILAALISCQKSPPVSAPPVAAPPAPSAATPPPAVPAPSGAAGSLYGRIVDEAGQPVIGATIQVTGPALPGFQGAATDVDGRYDLPYLPAGRGYEVKVEAPGYNTCARKGIEVPWNGSVNLPFTLSQGKTEIVVTAAAPMIDMKRTDSSTTIHSWPEAGGGGGWHRSRKEKPAPEPVLPPAAPSEIVDSVAGGVEGGVEGGVLGGVLGGVTTSVVPDELLVVEAPSGSGSQEPQPGEPPSPTQGTLRATGADGEVIGEFPLRHTEVSAEVSGYLAKTVVRQDYVNTFDEAIEAVYVFPLPSLAAVNGFVMEVGGRRIVGVVRPREEAEQIYREARAAGFTASLLTQERPNVFTQNVANIEPGGAVSVTITYFERLRYEHGTYEYVFPMVVGPRFVSGKVKAKPEDAEPSGGTSPATSRVPDADKVTPPALAPGERSGHDIGLTVRLDAGMAVSKVESPSHRVQIAESGGSRRTVTLSQADAIPNKDFVLRWDVAGAKTQVGVLAHRGADGGFFTLMVQPPRDPADSEVTPREVTFLLDVSGSMEGLPLEASKKIVSRTLEKLRPEDTFNVYAFADGGTRLWDAPRPKTPENAAEASSFLASLSGSGGTEMLAGIKAALEGQHDPKFLQMFVFCTDGYIANEARILKLVQEKRGQARFFAFGVGSSVNRYLIDGIGESGGGASQVVLPQNESEADAALGRFFDAIDSPVFVDMALDFDGMPVEEVYPSRLSDLFAGQTVSVIGKYTGAARGTAFLTATVAGRPVRVPVELDLPEARAENSALGAVWARQKIAQLSFEMLAADKAGKAERKQAITDLAVQFSLVSPYTAFVAVDESRVVGSGKSLRVLQPVEVPAGVGYRNVFGEPPAGKAVRVEAWGLTLQGTASGKVRVGQVDEKGPAAAAGVKAGAEVKAVGRQVVHDLTQMEGLLLQVGDKNVTVSFEPGGQAELPSP